jgi:hypothetical protein
MGKKYDHWCDNQHQEPSEDNKFVILNQKEVREILADYFNILIENVINSKYSYIIIKKEESDGRKLQD